MRVLPLAIAGTLVLAACPQSARSSGPSNPASPGASVGAGATATVATRAPRPLKLDGTFAAIPVRRFIPMWKTPGAPVADFTFDARDPFGEISYMLVDGVAAEASGRTWYRLLLPVRPNGRTAWVPESEVRLVPRRGRIVVDLSQRTLRYFEGHRLLDRFSVGVGMPQYPTAKGTFYVWIKVPFADASGPYGVFALGLSGFSPVLSDWPGGGRMAIHGTSDPNDRGQQVSHGCVRVYNPDMAKLRRVPPGTPVIIRR